MRCSPTDAPRRLPSRAARRAAPLLRAAAIAAACAAAAGPARADITLTVYNQNLALVRETRSFDLAPGVGSVEATDVPALIDPTSVHLRSLAAPERLVVLEQNFVYDLVSGERLLERYLDREVEVLTKQGNASRGALRSFAGGTLVLESPAAGGGGSGGTKMTLVSQPEVETVVLAGQDVSLVTRPTLVWLLDNRGAARQEIEIEYLTSGLSWHAEYAGVLDEKETALDLAAWVSLDNRSGKTYEDATLRVVAGEIHRAEEKRVRPRYADMMAAEAAPAGFAAREFAEYKLYALGRRTTVRDRETKQLSLFPNARTAVAKRFTFDARRDDDRVLVSYLFQNRKEEGLGIPLPAGVIRVYKEDGVGSVGLLGEDRIEHTPKDEEVEVAVGMAFDIVAERTVLAQRQISARTQETDVEIRFRNHKREAVEILVKEMVGGDWEIVASTFPPKRKSADTVEFTVPVQPDAEAVLAYTVRTRW